MELNHLIFQSTIKEIYQVDKTFHSILISTLKLITKMKAKK